MKKKRTYNISLIKARHVYTATEIAELFSIGIQTVRRWIKKGLKYVEGSTRPLYILGEDLKQFLREQSQKRKTPLGPDEFRCPKCSAPRRSVARRIRLEITGKKLGKHRKQVCIWGVCEKCGHSVMRLSSDVNARELLNAGMPIPQQQIVLIGNGDCCINDKIKGKKNEKDKSQK